MVAISTLSPSGNDQPITRTFANTILKKLDSAYPTKMPAVQRNKTSRVCLEIINTLKPTRKNRKR